jgi:hypothetical protein
VKGVELLVGGKDALGPVQHERASAQREDLRDRGVLGVDGRIGALQHHVDVVLDDELPSVAQLGVTPLFGP